MGVDVSKYANLGKSFEGASTPITGIESAVFRLSADITAELKEYFEKNNLNSSGALSNSIGGLPVRFSEQGAEIQIVAEDYFKFVDEGVDGLENKHGSPFSFKSLNGGGAASFKSWFGGRGITLLPRFQTYEQQAYAFAVSVKKKGIKPRKILEGLEKENGLEERIARSLELALGYAVELTITQIANVKSNK